MKQLECPTNPAVTAIADVNRDKPSDTLFAALDSGQVKRKSIRGAGVALGSQALRFVLQMGTTMILARLLSPEDFGLQGMVLATTALLGLLRVDPGLGRCWVCLWARLLAWRPSNATLLRMSKSQRCFGSMLGWDLH